MGNGNVKRKWKMEIEMEMGDGNGKWKGKMEMEMGMGNGKWEVGIGNERRGCEWASEGWEWEWE